MMGVNADERRVKFRRRMVVRKCCRSRRLDHAQEGNNVPVRGRYSRKLESCASFHIPQLVGRVLATVVGDRQGVILHLETCDVYTSSWPIAAKLKMVANREPGDVPFQILRIG